MKNFMTEMHCRMRNVWILLVLSLMLSSSIGFGQRLNLKVGRISSSSMIGKFRPFNMLALETRMGKRVSIQPEVGWRNSVDATKTTYLPKNRYLATDLRYYFCFRKDQFYRGLYAGIFVSNAFHRYLLEPNGNPIERKLSILSQGLVLGGQFPIARFFRIDAGMKLGMRSWFWQSDYNQLGKRIGHYSNYLTFAEHFQLYLQIGIVI